MHRHRMRFDRDPAFALQIHRIKKLILLVALVDRPRRLEQSIGQSGFAVIDVRDDAEIARQFDCHESRTMLGCARWVNARADRASRDDALRNISEANGSIALRTIALARRISRLPSLD